LIWTEERIMSARVFLRRPESVLITVTGACLLLGTTGAAGAVECVPPAEQPGVLRMLAAESRKTFDGLRTWEGVFEVDDVEFYFGERATRFLDDHAPNLTDRPAEFKKLNHARVTFAVDCARDLLLSRFESTDVCLVGLDSGQRLDVTLIPFIQTTIVTPEFSLQFSSNVRVAAAEGPGRRLAYLGAREEVARQEWGIVVDPREFPRGYGRPTWENLQMTAEFVELNGRLEIDGLALRVEKEGSGDQQEYRVVLPGKAGPGRYLFQEMTFRADAGFNTTQVVMRETTGPVRQQMRWAYLRQDDLWLPSFIERTVMTADGKRTTTQRTLRLVDSRANRALPAEVFTYRSLGLADEDQMLDERSGQLSVYRQGELIPLDSSTSESPARSAEP